MRRFVGWLVVLALVSAGVAWAATLPRGLPASEIAALPDGDPARGAQVFWIGGCDSCHARPGATGDERLLLGGGQQLKTAFGTFSVPNISPDPADGIGAWSAGDFANALQRGVSPDGRHYYPAFPFASYARMSVGDVADLYAFLRTLPSVAGRAPDSDLGFPWSVRRGVGLWKLAFLEDAPAVAIDTADPLVARGQYLAEGPGHCGECHTPRGIGGQMDLSRWLAGGPALEGQGKVPNITPGGSMGDWSAADLSYYFETGFTPDFDSVGGPMASVQRNLAELPPGDRDALAAYLKAVPPVP
jgi:mono/diheme cytochrome c family protein